jgi:hypothetical protein
MSDRVVKSPEPNAYLICQGCGKWWRFLVVAKDGNQYCLACLDERPKLDPRPRFARGRKW